MSHLLSTRNMQIIECIIFQTHVAIHNCNFHEDADRLAWLRGRGPVQLWNSRKLDPAILQHCELVLKNVDLMTLKAHPVKLQSFCQFGKNLSRQKCTHDRRSVQFQVFQWALRLGNRRCLYIGEEKSLVCSSWLRSCRNFLPLFLALCHPSMESVPAPG